MNKENETFHDRDDDQDEEVTGAVEPNEVAPVDPKDVEVTCYGGIRLPKIGASNASSV